VYEGYVAAVFEGDNIRGQYIKESLDRIVPFHAEFDKGTRFESETAATENIEDTWEMLFTEDDGSTFIAKGIFKQEKNIITGTIRTTTGDYRFLEGVISAETAKFSAFDGAHAFLFTAKVTEAGMEGVFYSGNHYEATFTAKRNATYELPHEDTLTFLNEGYDSLAFSFPDANGNIVSLTDDQFNDKVVIVQLMGTWCPNCLEESQYYKQYQEANKDKDVAFVALAFEYAKTEAKAFAGIKRLQDRIGMEYPILLAQYGSSDKAKAQEKLPMLNHVLSYPTTIFIDKNGNVRKIHTGFNGAATGDKFVSFKNEFEGFIEGLLGE
jgi:thiol-disulfide isomerase/thioredoxin